MADKLHVMLDSQCYSSKDAAKADMDAITSRLKHSSFVEVTREALLQAIGRGQTFVCGSFEPKQSNDYSKGWGPFIEQRLVAIDFDNVRTNPDKSKTPLKWYDHNYINEGAAVERAKSVGLDVVGVYETFNSTPDHLRFRMIADLGTTMTDFETAKKVLRDILHNQFPEADEACTPDPSTRYIGTNLIVTDGLGNVVCNHVRH